MSQSMIVWCVIAGVLLCAFVFRAATWYYTECSHGGHRTRHLFEMGKESDIFYVPGDVEDNDYEEL